ncbi:MAG: hypothetical protein NZ896_01850 [Nitrososphaerales archaeon]|nr:hypothetical protein [Nitrososphaerales archaeon]
MVSAKTLIKDSILKAISEFNKYRSPEATARLVKMGRKELILEFEGPFCISCGVYDYFEDFIHELKKFSDIGIKISDFKELKPYTIRVRYLLESPASSNSIDVAPP